MNCIDFRRQLASEPLCRDPAFVAHGEHCPHCRPAYRQALRDEATLHAALRVAVPEGLSDRILLAQSTQQRRQRWRRLRLPVLALAACLVLALMLSTLWQAGEQVSVPPLRSALADLAVDHLDYEPHALHANTVVPQALLARTLRTLGMVLSESPGDVHYMAVCPLGPHRSLHLVTQTAQGPVTLMFVPGAGPDEIRVDFRRQQVLGREFALAGGAMLLLADNDQDFDRIESAWRTALHPVTPTALGQH